MQNQAAVTCLLKMYCILSHGRAVVRWVQTGPQKVLVFLDGAAVHGSPFEVAVRSSPLSAPACLVVKLDSFGGTSPSKTRGDAFGLQY